MTWKEDESWRPIETAPKDGSRIALLIPYRREKLSEAECTDEGYWDAEVERLHWGDRKTDPDWKKLRPVAKGCFRFDGDDGPFDMQPTHWRPQHS
jgi:hypothetical protein